MEKIATREVLSRKVPLLPKAEEVTDVSQMFYPVRFKGAHVACAYVLIRCREVGSTEPNGHIGVKLFDSNDTEIPLDHPCITIIKRGPDIALDIKRQAELFDLAIAKNATSMVGANDHAAMLKRQPGFTELYGNLKVKIGRNDIVDAPDPDIPAPDPRPIVEEVELRIELDAAIHPEGIWRVEFHNHDRQSKQIFAFTVDSPASVVELRKSKLPFELFRNPFAELLKLMNLAIFVDGGRATITVRDEFSEITGIDQKLVFPLDLPMVEINELKLAGVTLTLQEYALPGTAEIRFSLQFEDGGPDEIAIDILPDVDLENIIGTLSLQVGDEYVFDPSQVFRIINGDELPWPIRVWAQIQVEDVDAPKWADAILEVLDVVGLADGDVNESVQMFAQQASTFLRDALVPKVRDYLVDIIQFLAQRDHVIHSISCDADSFIVRHHARPLHQRPRPIFGGGNAVPTDPGRSQMKRPLAGMPQPTLRQALTKAHPIAGGAKRPATATGGERARSPFQDVTSNRLNRRLKELDQIAPGGIDHDQDSIDHIVVLMMENRSFDHMLGYRKLEHGDESDGLDAEMFNTASDNPARKHFVWHLDRTVDIQSPHHGFHEVAKQISNGKMSGFIDSYATLVLEAELLGQQTNDVMGYYNSNELPFYHFAADNYAVCDRWFCSHPGPTQPNRFASICGVLPDLNNFSLDDTRLGYADIATIFDLLTFVGVSWNYVEHDIGFIRNLDRYRTDAKHVITYERFKEQLAAGHLASVTYVDPAFVDAPPAFDANDDHPPADVLAGQHLCADLYRALRDKDKLWRKTLLVITYDEHGGFYDHVSPKESIFDNIPKVHPDSPNMYGPRVPTLILSPWVNAGDVFSREFDHTSLIRTIMKRFCPARFLDLELLGPRVDRAADLFADLRAEPRTDTPQFVGDIAKATDPNVHFHNHRLRSDYHYMMQRLGLNARQREKLMR